VTRVDFYLIEKEPEGGKDTAICKLAHKAFRLGHRIYILTADREEAQRLDRLLWTFSDGSFIPHGLSSEKTDTNFPVLIGHDEPPPAYEDVLITVSGQVPDCFSRFQRVAEIVDGSEANKVMARERFRFYRDRGYALQTHTL
jgi:DNA polymerase-3 subunit chi